MSLLLILLQDAPDFSVKPRIDGLEAVGHVFMYGRCKMEKFSMACNKYKWLRGCNEKIEPKAVHFWTAFLRMILIFIEHIQVDIDVSLIVGGDFVDDLF